MKKIFISIFMLFILHSANAQFYMLIHQNDGNRLTIPVSTVDSVSYATAYDLAPHVVKLNKKTAALKVGETVELTASITKNDIAVNGTVEWNTSNNSIASISANGKVEAKKEGECDIIASYKTSEARCHITVLSSISIGGLVLYQSYADSTDVTSFDVKAQIDGLSTLEDDYVVYFYYTDDGTEPDNSSNGKRVRANLNDNVMASYSFTNMNMGFTYKFCVAVTTFEGDIYFGPTNNYIVTDIITKGDKIDIGIPGVYFASCNLGANSPEQKGNLYAWGETEMKANYSKSNYSYYNSSLGVWKDLGSDISGTKYDAATAVLGEGWHMPSCDIMDKLPLLCIVKNINYKGVGGILVLGYNGNAILLPSGECWTSSYVSSDEQKAKCWYGSSCYESNRYSGCVIRPVYGELDYPMEYVDLGLSVKWATCNVGACRPDDYGDYYAWGETEPKTNYRWSTYKWCNGLSNTLTKYCYESSDGNNGFTDTKTTLDLEDDVAHVQWGGSWRMPTHAELVDLVIECTWKWYGSGNTEFYGVAGYKVASNIEGYKDRFIFLPAAGYRGDARGHHGTLLNRVGSYGYYWSGSLGTDDPDDAWGLLFHSDRVSWNDDDRLYGFSVRPVLP